MDLEKSESRSREFKLWKWKIFHFTYCLYLKTFAWQLSFVVQFYFMLSFLLKLNSFFRSYNLELEMIRCSLEETSEDFEENKTAIWFTICLWILRKVKAALESSNFENKKYSILLLIAFIWKLLHDNYHLLFSFTSCLAFCRN